MYNIKYFAYGSNISIERLKNRVEFANKPVKEGLKYTLKNYSLVFNVGYGYNSFANVIPMNNSYVEGILYDLDEDQFRILDKYEGFYHRKYFKIDEETLGCIYIARSENIGNKRIKPNIDYLNIILDGCKETGLIKTYNTLVHYKNSNYKLKKGNRHELIT